MKKKRNKIIGACPIIRITGNPWKKKEVVLSKGGVSHDLGPHEILAWPLRFDREGQYPNQVSLGREGVRERENWIYMG